MRTHTYPSDVTDEQWALVEPLIPVYPGGRPRTTDVRDVLDAIFYLLRTGCQWRYLPKDLPPRRPSMTSCAIASAARRSPGSPATPPVSTASRWTPARAGKRSAGTTPRTSAGASAI